MASKNTEEADQPQLAPQPRRDEFGIARCIDTCPHYNAESPFFHPMCELTFEEKEEVTHAVIHSLCEPQARRDAEELQRLRGEAEDYLGQWHTTLNQLGEARAERDRLRAENARLVAMEQRAHRVWNHCGQPPGEYDIETARYILHGDPAPGEGERDRDKCDACGYVFNHDLDVPSMMLVTGRVLCERCAREGRR